VAVAGIVAAVAITGGLLGARAPDGDAQRGSAPLSAGERAEVFPPGKYGGPSQVGADCAGAGGRAGAAGGGLQPAARRIARMFAGVSLVRFGTVTWVVVRSWITARGLDDVGDDADARDGGGAVGQLAQGISRGGGARWRAARSGNGTPAAAGCREAGGREARASAWRSNPARAGCRGRSVTPEAEDPLHVAGRDEGVAAGRCPSGTATEGRTAS
jgi:hypothetical protein